MAVAIVERGYGHAGLFVDAAAHMLAGIGLAAESVLGREYRGNIDA